MTAPASPAPGSRATPSGPPGQLVAALALLVLAPPAILGWVAGAVVVRFGWVSRGRLSAAGVVTGALAFLLIGPTATADGLLSAVAALGAVQPVLTPAAVLDALSAVLVRGVGVAAVTIPAGVTIAAVNHPRDAAVVTPEWEASERRRKSRADARARRRAERLTSSPRIIESDALGVALTPEVQLPEWRRGPLIVPPAGQLGLTTLLVGGPGVGKSTAAERLSHLAAKERRHLCVIDGKGTDGLAESIAAAVLAAWPDARIRSFPEHPVDLWRGTPQQLANRLVACWSFSQEAEFYEQAAMLGLRLALTAPGPPVRSMAELVTRLEPSWLERTWQGHPGTLSLIRGPMKGRLGDVALRASNLAAALGPAWDGDWWLDDVDLALFTVPTMANPKDADAAMRVLIASYGQWLTTRRERRPSMLLFDEFGTVVGGRPLAINLVERSRSAGSGILLSAQSAAGLGDETDRARLLASANAVILFRSPQPAELAQLAGSERVPEAAWQLDGDDLTGRSTITVRARSRVDADQVRAARTGEAVVIAAGRVERIRVIRTAIPEPVHTRALEVCRGPELERPAGGGPARLSGLGSPDSDGGPGAGGPGPPAVLAGEDRPRPTGAAPGDPGPKRGPADAVDRRGVPGPAQQRQGQAATRSPTASLDPPGPGRVRRYRPLGPSGETAPPDDHHNQEGTP